LNLSTVIHNKFEEAKEILLDLQSFASSDIEEIRSRFQARNQLFGGNTIEYYQSLVELCNEAFSNLDAPQKAEIIFTKATSGLFNRAAAESVLMQYAANKELRHENVLKWLLS